MKKIAHILIFSLIIFGCKDKKVDEKPMDDNAQLITEPEGDLDGGEAANNAGFTIDPISHASMVLQWDGTIIYVDPVGGKEAFSDNTEPDLILITDIHQDHMDIPTLEGVVKANTKIIAPQAVADKLPESLKSQVQVLGNGQTEEFIGFSIEGIPMYNLRKEALKFHTKGRGNGYVIQKDEKRVYISGDTEDIPEMRNLKNIDIAFVCMNLPYTMTVDKAAEAVLAFKPVTVYPYHYRGQDGMSDVAKFKSLVEAGNPDIKVTQLDWYPQQ